jgi:hypothetical protein
MFGIFRHYQQMRQLGLGRGGFLTEQSSYFDKITKLHSLGFMLMAGVILAGIAVGLYELVAAGFTKILPTVAVEE